MSQCATSTTHPPPPPTNHNHDNPNQTCDKLTISVVLLCGVAGSGKSTLAKRMMRHYRHHANGTLPSTMMDFDRVVLIDYDGITRHLAGREHENENENEEDGNEDGNVSSSSTHHEDVENENGFDEKDLQAWRQTRKEALHRLSRELEYNHDMIHPPTNDTPSSNTNHPIKERKVMIILDDNFHLRSMRRNVYKICQTFVQSKHANLLLKETETSSSSSSMTLGFSVVHVECPPSECLRRNSQRRGIHRVPLGVMEDMIQSFQPPDPIKNPRVDSCCCTIVTTTEENHHDWEFVPPSELMQCLQKSLSTHPVLPPPPSSSLQRTPEELEAERIQTARSKQHGQDLWLRKIVGVVCRFDPSLAKRANLVKKVLWKELKSAAEVENWNRDGNGEMDDCDFEFGFGSRGWILERFQQLMQIPCEKTSSSSSSSSSQGWMELLYQSQEEFAEDGNGSGG